MIILQLNISLVTWLESLVLCYFDNLKGPSISHAVPLGASSDPADLPPDLGNQILKMIDTHTTESFFTYGFETYATANLYFEIPSDWARGKREILCLSVLTHSGRVELFKQTLIEGAQRFKAIPNIYKAFHPEKTAGDNEVEKKQKELEKFLANLGQDVIRVRDEGLTQVSNRERSRDETRDRARDEARDRARDETRDRARDEAHDRQRDGVHS